MNFWLSQDKDELEKVFDRKKTACKGQFFVMIINKIISTIFRIYRP